MAFKSFDLFSFRVPLMFNKGYSYKSNKSTTLSIIYLSVIILITGLFIWEVNSL